MTTTVKVLANAHQSSRGKPLRTVVNSMSGGGVVATDVPNGEEKTFHVAEGHPIQVLEIEVEE